VSFPETTYRCGWRIQRVSGGGALFSFDSFMVTVRRGAWKMRMHAAVFDAMDDDAFADVAERAYRESAFEQLQQDLDALAPIAAAVLSGDVANLADTDWNAVKGAVYRQERAAKDIEAAKATEAGRATWPPITAS